MSYIGNTATQQAFTPAVDFFNGNGSTTAFTLSRPVASVAQVQAVISNVPQKPGDAYTVSGNTITFTSAPPSGTQNIYVYYTSPITQVIAPGQNTVSPASLSTGAPSWDTSGNVTTTGTVNNLTVGRGAGSVATNTAVGASALAANTTGAENTAVGQGAAAATTTGNYNTAMGRNTFALNTTGSSNAAFGQAAMYSNTTGGSNTGIGFQALALNTTASQNTAVGYQAAYSNTTGAYNTAVGWSALYTNSTGERNSAFGRATLGSNTTGSYNTAFGMESLNQNTTASNNTAVGYQAGLYATGGGNTYIGVSSGANNTNPSSGTNNTTIGYQAGRNISSGNSNVAIGMNTGYSIGTGSNNIYIGVCDSSVQNVTHEIAIATSGLAGKGANTAFISANGGSTYNGANTTTWATTSDQRIKKNIVDVTSALSKIIALRPVEFDYKENDKHETGFIAQEYETVFPEQIIHHTASPAEKEWVGDEDVKAIQQNLVPYLVAAIKELKAEFDAYKEAHP